MRIIVDTGFWYGLYCKGDQWHSRAVKIAERLEFASDILIPWPSLYETLNTDFIKNDHWVKDFSRRINSRNYTKVDDSKYREECLSSATGYPQKSLVDYTICAMMKEYSGIINGIITFDPGGFSEIAALRSIEIIS